MEWRLRERARSEIRGAGGDLRPLPLGRGGKWRAWTETLFYVRRGTFLKKESRAALSALIRGIPALTHRSTSYMFGWVGVGLRWEQNMPKDANR